MPSRFRSGIIAVSAVAAAATLLLFPYSRKKAIESSLSRASRYIQEKNLEKLMPLISLYYKDETGMTYASMSGSFDYVFKQYQDIRISYAVDSISCGKDTSAAHITLWAHAGIAGIDQDLVGTEFGKEPLDVYYVREFLKYKIIGSRWPVHKPGIQDFY
jgi:hypothetical protein